MRPATATIVDVLIGMALLALVVFNAATRPIHKWAHQSERPYVVQLLQRARLIVSPEHHAGHRAAPHTRN